MIKRLLIFYKTIPDVAWEMKQGQKSPMGSIAGQSVTVPCVQCPKTNDPRTDLNYCLNCPECNKMVEHYVECKFEAKKEVPVLKQISKDAKAPTGVFNP
jgi:hypothetical protein